jgi:hypothetical protein
MRSTETVYGRECMDEGILCSLDGFEMEEFLEVASHKRKE